VTNHRKPLSRRKLVALLAQVSHKTWMRQKAADLGVNPICLPGKVTKHDRERAEDTVKALEEFGIF
jgi:hypothetical protein